MTDPASSRTSGHHLFLEPSGGTADSLRVLMAFLATDHDAPIFPPHVTLLSGIPADSEENLIEMARTLAATSSPFDIYLGDAAAEDKYFRALYLSIQEGSEISELHQQAAAIFSMESDEEYMPHLSLLYGNYPGELKEEIISDLQVPAGMSFLVDRIHLWRTEGEVADWVRIASFEIGVL